MFSLYKSRQGKYLPRARCKECIRKEKYVWRDRNIEKVKSSEVKYYKTHTEECKTRSKEVKKRLGREWVNRISLSWQRSNKDKLKNYRHKYYENNKSEYLAYTRYRQATKKLRTPKWINPKEFIGIYKEAKALTIRTGVPHEVDHIVPLHGKTVSGLHVPWNLQILTLTKNRTKWNKF
jgi:hypothetical protein